MVLVSFMRGWIFSLKMSFIFYEWVKRGKGAFIIMEYL